MNSETTSNPDTQETPDTKSEKEKTKPLGEPGPECPQPVDFDNDNDWVNSCVDDDYCPLCKRSNRGRRDCGHLVMQIDTTHGIDCFSRGVRRVVNEALRRIALNHARSEWGWDEWDKLGKEEREDLIRNAESHRDCLWELRELCEQCADRSGSYESDTGNFACGDSTCVSFWAKGVQEFMNRMRGEIRGM